MTETPRRKRTPGRIVLIVCLSLLGFVAAVLLGGRLYFRLPVRDYYAASVPAFAIPGLSEGFVPQGIAWDEEADVFLVGGYRTGHGNASPVYAVDRVSGAVKAHATLERADGSAYTGHCGGLSVWGDNVYVADGDGLCIFDREAVLAARDGAPVQALGRIATPLSGDDSLGVSWVSVEGDEMTVGEFYLEGPYPTPESHKFTAPSGEFLQALAVTYRLSEDGGSLTPLRAWCLPDKVQGLTTRGGRLWLSTSWAVGFSHLYAYDPAALTPFAALSVDGTEVPLYALDSAARTADYKLPPMAEEIVFAVFDETRLVKATDSDEQVKITEPTVHLLTMSESASRKYWFGLLTGGQWCYATDLTQLTPVE